MSKSQPFAQTGKPVRNSAKAIIIVEGRLLTTKNHDLFGDFYLLPGGGQNHSEILVETLKRECLEETGATIEVADLVLIREYLSARHQFAEFDPTIHQIEFMFACHLLEPVLTHPTTEHDSMQTGIAWLEISKLDEYRLYPEVLKSLLKKHPDLIFPKIYLGDIN
ncbi:MAG: NUDIX domain-containing protein [Candidatus Rifleibacteriota bacterium]